MTNRFFIHMFFDRHFGQGPTVIALVAADPPFFHPFFLDIGLTALRTHKYAFFIKHPTFFFHPTPLVNACNLLTIA